MKLSSKERRNRMLEQLRQTNKITVQECAEYFDVSEVSIRNDMEYLEKKGLLIRVKGGGISAAKVEEEDDLPIHSKALVRAREKKAIGKAAAELINEGETIILDAGTTTLEIAKHLDRFNNLTIITNAVNIAFELSRYQRFSIIMLGGYMRPASLSITGMNAESTLKNFYVDKLFLGVDSINLQKGISTPNADEASINRIMMECAHDTIAVCDSSKFERRSFARICYTNEISTLVTDSGIPEEARSQISEMGVNVIAVNV